MLSLRNITFASPDPRQLADFWAAALGLPERRDGTDEVLLADADWGYPRYTFQRWHSAPADGANRVHLDLLSDDRATEVERLVGLGASEVRTVDDDPSGVVWTVMIDPGGNELCVTHGYGAASVEVITEAAGLSRGALYSNFTDKDDLYLDLLDELEQNQTVELAAIFEEHQDLSRFLERLAARGRAGVHDSRSHMILHTELWLLAMRNPAVRERLATIHRRGIEAIATLVGSAKIDLAPEEIAATVAAINDGLLMQRLLDPDSVREGLHIDVLRLLAALTGLLDPGETS